MAQDTNTYDVFDLNEKRETIANVMEMISPDETPFRSWLPKEKLDGTHPEWLTDELELPNADNKFVQGDEYDFDAISQAAKVGTYTQISRKTFKVAETVESQAKVGDRSTYNRTMVKKAKELKIDQEVILLGNQASSPGSGSVPATTAGLRAWIATNDLMGSGGSSGGYNVSTGVVDAAVNGTQRTFTKDLLDQAIQAAYNNGGAPTQVMMANYPKTVFSKFMSDANVIAQRRMAKDSDGGGQRIIAAADEYQSDFGLVSVLPNRQMTRASLRGGNPNISRNIFLLQKDKLALGTLRPIQEDNDVAKTGDALPGVIKTEYALIVKHEGALACIADVYGLTAST